MKSQTMNVNYLNFSFYENQRPYDTRPKKTGAWIIGNLLSRLLWRNSLEISPPFISKTGYGESIFIPS